MEEKHTEFKPEPAEENGTEPEETELIAADAEVEATKNRTEPDAAEDKAASSGVSTGKGTGKKSGRRRKSGWLKFVAAFAAGFAACLAVFAIALYPAGLGRIISKTDFDYYKGLNEKFGKYYYITEMIKQDPLVKKEPQIVSEDSVREMVENLGDPYAAYYTPEEYEGFTKYFNADYVGIGILVEENDKGLFVMQVYDDGPAQGAGMKAGDQIIRVDDVVPENIDDAVSRMTGEEGTKVTVTVRRDGKELDLRMKRAAINLDSVGYAVSEDDPKVGYIRISIFAEDTCDEFKSAVKALKDKGCERFILDLRDNGGGLTQASIDIADYLLPACRIMTEISKDGSKKEYKSEKSSADLDLVVLVNENTASASEILTAAIKENDGGKVIGTRTYGKGVTQMSHQFKDGYAIKLTVTEYLTPDGNHVQDKGIEPDVEATEEDILDKALEELKN